MKRINQDVSVIHLFRHHQRANSVFIEIAISYTQTNVIKGGKRTSMIEFVPKYAKLVLPHIYVCMASSLLMTSL